MYWAAKSGAVGRPDVSVTPAPIVDKEAAAARGIGWLSAARQRFAQLHCAKGGEAETRHRRCGEPALHSTPLGIICCADVARRVRYLQIYCTGELAGARDRAGVPASSVVRRAMQPARAALYACTV